MYIHYKVHIHKKMTESTKITEISEKADAKNAEKQNDIQEKAEEIKEVEDDFVNVETKPEETKPEETKPVPLEKAKANGAKLVQCMQTIVAMKKKKQEILSKRRKESDEALNKRGVKTDIKPCQLRKVRKPPLCIRTPPPPTFFPTYKTMAEIKADEEKAAADAKVIAEKKEQDFRNKIEARQHSIISELYQCNKQSMSAATLVKEIKTNLIKNIVLLTEDLTEEFSIGNSSSSNNTLDLMIFEDDTFKLVPHLPEKNMDIILSFYEQSDNIVDVEATTVSFPDGKIDDILFKSVNVSHKDEFVASFLPQYIIHKQMENNLDAFQSKYKLKKNSASINGYDGYDGPGFGSSSSVMSGIVLPALLKKQAVVAKKNDLDSNISETGNIYMVDQWGFNASSKSMPMFKEEKSNNDNDEEDFCPADSSRDQLEGFSFGTHHGWFNSDMESIGQIEQEKDPKDARKNIVVLLNKENAKTIRTIVLTDPSDAILETVEEYSEYGWTQLFSLQSKLPAIAEFIRKKFDAANFYNTDALNAMLESTASFVKSSRATAKDEYVVQSEESAVIEFLKDRYSIDDNVEHKLKASALCDVIVQNEIVKISDNQLTSFKNRLARYLKTLGLRKKRYNDGFYYYGIQKKKTTFPVPLLSAGVGTRQMFDSLDKDKTTLSDYTYTPESLIGLDTKSSRNANLSIRSEPPNPQANIGIWNHFITPACSDSEFAKEEIAMEGTPSTKDTKIFCSRSDKPSANATIGVWNSSTISPDYKPINS